MYSWMIPFVVLLSQASCETLPKKLPNIDFLGKGYNVFIGNPHTDLRDPGFRNKILALTYNNSNPSADGSWQLPDSVGLQPVTSCSYDLKSEQIAKLGEYQESLSVDAKLEGSADFALWNGKFSASTEYKKVEKEMKKSNNVFIESLAKCIVYIASADLDIKVDPSFVRAVTKLPMSEDSLNPYFKFIEHFGTHYISEMVMGAKAIQTDEIKEDELFNLQSQNVNVHAEIQTSFLSKFSVGASTDVEKSSASKSKFNSAVLKHSESYIGSRPSSDGKFETWANDVGKTPYPVEYTIHEIQDLINEENFPELKSDDLERKKSLLTDALKKYCGERLPNCGLREVEDRNKFISGSPYLKPGQTMLIDEYLSSEGNKCFKLILQQDGNMVIYRIRDEKPIWNSLTQNTGANSVRMGKNGNLVISDADNSPVWSTETSADHAFLQLQADGNLIIIHPKQGAIWASHSETSDNEC